ncbi:MAG: sigma-70 family RNA polymerase sigma factor, partial [Spirulina sp.]
TRLIIEIKRSGKLWRENTPYYEDALQQTWLFLSQNLCEALTAKKAYDAKIGTVTTWLNSYLRHRLQDYYAKEKKEKERRIAIAPKYEDMDFNLLDTLPASPDTPPILEETLGWIERDRTGELRRVHIKGRPDLTCQLLLLRRFPPETAWQVLAKELHCSCGTLASFYQRQCLPRLRKFAQMQGYIS